MIQRFFYLTLLLVITATASAQDDLNEKMNAIKMNQEYYWGEATSETPESAKADAIMLLVEKILADDKKVTDQQIKGDVKFMTLPRGERTRAFAYIRRVLVKADNIGTNVAESNVAEQVEIQVVQSSNVQDVPVISSSNVTSSVLMSIVQCEMKSDVWRCLEAFRREGSINDCGQVTSKAQLADGNYLVIYDDEDVVKAILAPAYGGERKNIATGNADNTKNYRGCRVMWFK